MVDVAYIYILDGAGSFQASWGGAAPCCGLQLGLFRDAAVGTPAAVVLARNPSGLEVNVTGLAAATTYTLRWRSRNTNSVNFGWGWGNWSAPFVCTTAHATGATGDTEVLPVLPNQAKTVRMYRISEFSLDVDFLSNHSSGDAAGEAVLLSAFVRRSGSTWSLNQSCLDALDVACPGLRGAGARCLACTSAYLPMPACGTEQPSTTFRQNDNAHFFCGASAWMDPWQAPIAEYTVDYLPSPTPQSCVPHVINGTAYGCRDQGFGPYLSCDAPEYGFDNTPLHPLCNCQVSIDRMLSRLDQNVTDTVCPPNALKDHQGNPLCNCTLSFMKDHVTAEETLRFVGQSPIYTPLFHMGDYGKRVGSFFSTGALGECDGERQLGIGCYWKMRPLVRVIHFPELTAAGFQPCDGSQDCPMLNIQAFERAWVNLNEYVRPSEIVGR